jgi:large subunit ribosomal protein L31
LRKLLFVSVQPLFRTDPFAAGETAASGAQVRRKIMREGIHPKYYQATVTCNCGNTFVTGSTSPEIHVEVCSKCHSFYTGTQKTAAAKGRIDKFNRKYGLGNK